MLFPGSYCSLHALLLWNIHCYAWHSRWRADSKVGEWYKCTGAWNALISWGCRNCGLSGMMHGLTDWSTPPCKRKCVFVCVCVYRSDVSLYTSPAGGGDTQKFLCELWSGFLLYFSSFPCLSWNVCSYGWWRALWTASRHQTVLCPCVLEATVISIL